MTRRPRRCALMYHSCSCSQMLTVLRLRKVEDTTAGGHGHYALGIAYSRPQSTGHDWSGMPKSRCGGRQSRRESIHLPKPGSHEPAAGLLEPNTGIVRSTNIGPCTSFLGLGTQSHDSRVHESSKQEQERGIHTLHLDVGATP